MTPRSKEREGVEGWGEAALLPPPPSSPFAPVPPLAAAPSPTPARASPAALASPPARPQHPPTHPRPANAPRVIFIRNIPKSVPLAQAEPRAALTLISQPRLLPSGRAGGGGVGEGWVGGVGGRGGPSRPSPPWASRAGAARRPRSVPRRPDLGVSLPPAVSADAEGRCPSRAEGTRPGCGAGPGARARAGACARGARQKLR